MAHISAIRQFEAPHPASAEDLRRLFETAVCEIHKADPGVKRGLSYRTPIVQRGRFSELSGEGLKKRALSDAARALAQLWKV
jgi:hypothetical protein